MGVLQTERNSGKTGALARFTQGIDVDQRLAAQEVRVQSAWARALGRIGVLSSGESEQVLKALQQALSEMDGGTFDWRMEDEDVHMNLERFVTEKCGALGKKMHVGRSRNDLIATSLRLFSADACDAMSARIRDMAHALAEQARAQAGVIVPGMTHLQHGQPIRLGHAFAAHGWAFARDLDRLANAKKRALESMPLGSAALGGTTLPLDLSALARELGFQGPSLNSYDSVGDRDFLLEAIDAYASCAMHLSRLAEDMVIWSSTAIGLVKLPPDWSTGSSIMPNKRNPDVPELVRGKSAHVIGAAANAHTLLKAVPTSYGSDLHELKQVYLRALDELAACLEVFPSFIRGLKIDVAKAAQLLNTGHVLATEIADELAVNQGVPFREAYAQVAALVEKAEARGCQVHALPAEEFSAIAPSLLREFLARLTPEAAVERRSASGGTSLARVLGGIEALAVRLGF